MKESSSSTVHSVLSGMLQSCTLLERHVRRRQVGGREGERGGREEGGREGGRGEGERREGGRERGERGGREEGGREEELVHTG